MYKKFFLPIFLIIVALVISCKLFEKEEPKPIDVYGCMDSTATNYNPDATIDDGSCEYDVFGCMDSTANNYNHEATIDDGSCDYCREGSSFLLISTDGGNTWDIRCLREKIGMITDISMIDSNNIWICTYPTSKVQNAQILYTYNGGKTWEQQIYFDSPNPYSEETFEYIEMFDLNNGIALANHITNEIPIFLKTIDGGKNWIQTTTDAIGVSGDMWRRVDFVDVNIGYFYESLVNPQKLYKTINSGITWNETNYVGGVMVLKFFDEDIGIAVTDYGKIHRTLDGAETWEEIETTHTGWGMDIEFDPNDPSKVWLLTDDVYFSSDTGSTWIDYTGAEKIGGQALCRTQSKVWILSNGTFYSIDINDTNNIKTVLLPEYSYGDLLLQYDFDIVGDIIVIPGRFSE